MWLLGWEVVAASGRSVLVAFHQLVTLRYPARAVAAILQGCAIVSGARFWVSIVSVQPSANAQMFVVRAGASCLFSLPARRFSSVFGTLVTCVFHFLVFVDAVL